MVSREDWAIDFLTALDYPVTKNNKVSLIAWMAAEGGPQQPQALWNPLNTTQLWAGSWRFNYINVQNYAMRSDGVAASKKTLLGKGWRYWRIRRCLKGSADPLKTTTAIEKSNWGTSGLAHSIVDDVERLYESYATKPIGWR